MFIQRSQANNPYAAYQKLVERRALTGSSSMALNGPELSLGDLVAPAVRTRLLAHSERYERLGNSARALLPALGALAEPGATWLGHLSSRIPAGSAADSLQAPAMAATGAAAAARPATLRGDVAISLRPGQAGTTASMMSEAPRLGSETGTPATYASLTMGQVALETSKMVKAELHGSNLKLHKAKEADFGSITINGVTTTIGVAAPQNDLEAAQFIADRINGNADNTVTATIDRNERSVILTAKNAGTAGNISIDRVTADSDGKTSNDVSTGFKVGAAAAGSDGGSSDFGSVTINGVTTSFGVRSNAQQTPQSTAQWLVDRLNANTANDFTASVGGDALDQIVLTSRTPGSQGVLRIDQVLSDSDANLSNTAITGFTAGSFAQGQDAAPGMTDLGSVTINGVTTTFGVVSNADQTSQGIARLMVDRLNANEDNTVIASLGGQNQDQVILTAKTPGSAGSFRIERSSSDSNGRTEDDGFNGWAEGRSAAGVDATSGLTDFGSLTINGFTTRLGVLDGRDHTPQSALQYLIDRLNQSNPTITAREEDGHLVIGSRTTGSKASLTVEAVTSDSDGDPTNDQALGFAPGMAAVGSDASGSSSGSASVAIAGSSRGSTIEGFMDQQVDDQQVARQVDKASGFAQDLTRYLQSLREQAQDLPRSVQGFGNELRKTLQGETETLQKLGMRLTDDGLEVDEATLGKAMQQDPGSVTDGFKRLHQALEASVGAQAFALDEMRAATHATGDAATTMSQVAASIYKIQHRAGRIQWMLEQVQPAAESLREQSDRLRKLGEEKDEQKEKQVERHQKDEADQTGLARPSERDARGFGLLRSPVPEGYFASAPSRGSQPQWPF